MRFLQGEGSGQATALAYSPDGNLLAVGTRDGLVDLWCPHTGRILLTLRYENRSAEIVSLSFHPDGRSLAAGTTLASVAVWDTATGQPLRHLPAGASEHLPAHATVVLHRPDGGRLVAGQMGIVTDWPAGSDTPVRVLRPLYSYMVKPVWSLAYGPENVLAVGEVNHVQLWPANGTRVLTELNWPAGEIVALHFLPGHGEAHGAALLVARGRDVGVFRVQVGHHWRRQHVLRHSDPIRAVALTADGRRLLTGGDDWTVRVWDTSVWQKAHELNFRIGPVQLLAVAPDGMTAAAVGAHRPGVLVWDLE